MKVRERQFDTGWVISVKDKFSQGAYLIERCGVDIVPLLIPEDVWRAVNDLNVSDFSATALPPPMERSRLSSVM